MERVLERVPVGFEPRHGHIPDGKRLADAVAFLAEVPLDLHRRLHCGPGRERQDVETQVPTPTRLELDLELDAVARDGALTRDDDLRRCVARRVVEQKAIVLGIEAAADWRWERLRVCGIAEGEVPVLDGDDVGEIGVERDAHAKRERLHRHVRQQHVILHAGADEALALNRQGVRRHRARWIAREERGREVVDGRRREQRRALSVDGDLESREEAHVLGEEAMGRA